MPSVIRLNDQNVAGGIIDTIPSNTTVFANDLLIAVNGSSGTSDSSCSMNNTHCATNWVTANGSPNIFINNIPINRQGDLDTCGHARDTGSLNVFANG